MRNSLILFVLVLLLVFGCDAAKPRKPQQEGPAPPAIEEPQSEPVGENASEPETVQVEAAVGMTGKGQHNHGGGEKPMDPILVPASQFFRIQERVALQQIQHAENLYKAQHEKLPATHEEYVRDVLQGMPLPKLPDGHKFVYDPEKQQLMVEKPK